MRVFGKYLLIAFCIGLVLGRNSGVCRFKYTDQSKHLVKKQLSFVKARRFSTGNSHITPFIFVDNLRGYIYSSSIFSDGPDKAFNHKRLLFFKKGISSRRMDLPEPVSHVPYCHVKCLATKDPLEKESLLFLSRSEKTGYLFQDYLNDIDPIIQI